MMIAVPSIYKFYRSINGWEEHYYIKDDNGIWYNYYIYGDKTELVCSKFRHALPCVVPMNMDDPGETLERFMKLLVLK